MLKKLNPIHFAALASGVAIWAGIAMVMIPPTEDMGEPRLVVGLIDGSDFDKLSNLQQDEIRRKIRGELIERSSPGDRVALFALSENENAPLKILLDSFRPQEPTRMEIAEKGSNKVEEERAARDDEFLASFNEAVSKALLPGSKPLSPLIEGVVDLQTWITNQDQKEVRALLLSDYLQNSSRCSAYVKPLPECFDQLIASVNGQSIELTSVYFSRRDVEQYQTTRQQDWAKQFAESITTSSVSWEKI